ncbi:MAG: ATP-binding protein, partial [Frankiales bacterium]|nr:ATP-binding protein [Frankiales bacterium]
AVRACQLLLAQMEEADSYCAAGVLMTLPTPPDQRALREWYLGEFVRQGRGLPPTPWAEPVD